MLVDYPRGLGWLGRTKRSLGYGRGFFQRGTPMKMEILLLWALVLAASILPIYLYLIR
jgi:hypothetical protein